MGYTLGPDNRSTALMPKVYVNTNSDGGSWAGDRKFRGIQNPQKFVGKITDIPSSSVLQEQAKTAAILPSNLPDASNLSSESLTKISTAVQKSLTTLSYSIANEMGRLDLNYLKTHLVNLTPNEQQLAIHATVQTLSQPEFAGLARSVKTLRLPFNLALSLETLDLLTSDSFKSLDLKQLTIQDAALEGNLSFLRYAEKKGFLDDFALRNSASTILDAGKPSVEDRQLLLNRISRDPIYGTYDVVKAAVLSGNPNVIHYLASLDSFKQYPFLENIIKDAAKYGQIDTAIALGEGSLRPITLSAVLEKAPGKLSLEILERYHKTLGKLLRIDPETSVLLVENIISNNALDKITRLKELGVDISNIDDPETKQPAIDIMLDKATDGPRTEDLLEAARSLGVEDDLLIQAGKKDKVDLISVKLNEKRRQEGGDFAGIPFGVHDPDAELAVAHMKFPDSETGKNDYEEVNASTLRLGVARELVQKALVYSHDRLRADRTGKNERVRGWTNLLNSMKNEPALTALKDLINQTIVQLNGMNSNNQNERNQRREKAKNVLGGAPDLDPEIRNAETFVPGKGVINPPLYGN
ncbi:MAG: hypothetical protein AAGG81_06970 [Chlamydiota bacterium]